MITIDQLLESVDLDFEPRWVTKDETGVIELWEKKPNKTNYGCWTCYGWQTRLAVLKLAEFDGKGWTECIYEVPRKESEIERLETDADYMQLSSTSMTRNQDVADTIMEKINELVDAVNELKGAKNE